MKLKLITGSVVVVILLAMMFSGPRDTLTVQRIMLHAIMPLLTVMLFWINYLWLAPLLTFKNKKWQAITSNAVLILLFGSFLTFWHDYEFLYERNDQKPEWIQKEENRKDERRIPENRREGRWDDGPERRDHEKTMAEDNGKPPEIMDGPRGEMPPDGMDKPDRRDHRNKWKRKERRGHLNLLASLRDTLNFLFAIVLAYYIRSQQRIARLREQQQQAEMARHDAELRSLRNQISPHFLLNTLNNIYALAAIDTERTQDAVLKLSKMLRHLLYDNQAELVTLHSEAEFIRSYIDLMRLRLARNVKVEATFDIREDSKTLVAPLLFISLVENAFKHGVSSTEPCLVSITLKETDESIICDISNSNHPKAQTDRSGHGVGLQVVQKRLDMVYPGHYTWNKGVGNDGLYHSTIILKHNEVFGKKSVKS